jgi:mannose/fructose-specific phosphotransferase system component IIA
MSEPLRGVIVSHAAIAQALVFAVTVITGIDGALVPISNEGCDNDALGDRLRQAVGERPAVLFVDLPGGSCLTNSIRFAKQHADIAVVTGVNLAMLLDFVFHRDVSPVEAARRAVDAGAKAIRVPAA